MEEIDKLDLSPHAYMVVHGTLSDTSKANIESIKNEYGYKGDLLGVLINLPSWVNSYKDVYRQRGRPKIKKQLLTKTRKAAEELKKCLKSFSGEMRLNMRDNRQKENPFGIFKAIENNLPGLIEKCLIEEVKIPTDKGGQKKGSVVQDMLWLLIQYYEYNVGLEAKCGWDELQAEHVGRFYKFIVEIKPFLAEMDIELGESEDRTIGQYIRELLTLRNKKRVEHLSNILLLLDNNTFFYQYCSKIAYFWMSCLFHELYLLKSPEFSFE